LLVVCRPPASEKTIGVTDLLSGLLVMVAVVAAHELGHATAATAYGFRWRAFVTPTKLGVRVLATRDEVTAAQNAAMAAAGPAASFLLAAAAWAAGSVQLTVLSAMVGLLSLVPIRPQDGYWIWIGTVRPELWRAGS
jgi:Zn-dependent protease